METRTFFDIDISNLFAMQYYTLSALEPDLTFLIVGDNGFPDYYRVEIRFIHTGYISCPTVFTNAFSFRRATEEEALPIQGLLKTQEVNVFCLERHRAYDITRDGTRLEVIPYKCFISAVSVEITLYFGGDMQGFLKQHSIE